MLCEDKVPLKKMLEQLIEEGGEGVILRKPYSLYIPGRSDSLIKLKVSKYSPLNVI
jgi:ATP-dependent DNA ligase